jgi:hypothetical protein
MTSVTGEDDVVLKRFNGEVEKAGKLNGGAGKGSSNPIQGSFVCFAPSRIRAKDERGRWG